MSHSISFNLDVIPSPHTSKALQMESFKQFLDTASIKIRGKITGFDTSKDLDASLAIFRFILHISEKLHQAGLSIKGLSI